VLGALAAPVLALASQPSAGSAWKPHRPSLFGSLGQPTCNRPSRLDRSNGASLRRRWPSRAGSLERLLGACRVVELRIGVVVEQQQAERSLVLVLREVERRAPPSAKPRHGGAAANVPRRRARQSSGTGG
jgi:hypothetical protein